MDIQHFADKHRVTLKAKYLGLDVDADGWKHHAYKVIVRRGRKSITTEYKMGIGHSAGEVKLVDVLDALRIDADSYLNSSNLQDFCDTYGFDSDSRKAEKCYKACEKMRWALARVFGEDGLSELLACEAL